VSLRQIAGASSAATQTDKSGQFKIAALPPGRYELQITKQGFATTSGQIELQAQDLATISSRLKVGAVAEKVEVEAQDNIASLTIESAAPPMLVRPATGASELPLNGRNVTDLKVLSNTPIAATISRGKLMLRADAAGALSFSKDSGKHWKAVKPHWTGKVVQLTTRAESPTNPEAFQIATDLGAVWLSRDGLHWYQDSAPR
jgi:hypothetical protein